MLVGFNEFCNPTLEKTLDTAVANGAEKIIVITPMMTPGGEHSEIEIPAIIKRAQERSPGVEILYAWPFEIAEVAKFLTSQIEKSIKE